MKANAWFLVIDTLVIIVTLALFRTEIRVLFACFRNRWKPKSVTGTNGTTKWYGVDSNGRWHRIGGSHDDD